MTVRPGVLNIVGMLRRRLGALLGQYTDSIHHTGGMVNPVVPGAALPSIILGDGDVSNSLHLGKDKIYPFVSGGPGLSSR